MAFQRLVPKVRLDIAGAVSLHGKSNISLEQRALRTMLLNRSHVISLEVETSSSPKVEKRNSLTADNIYEFPPEAEVSMKLQAQRPYFIKSQKSLDDEKN